MACYCVLSQYENHIEEWKEKSMTHCRMLLSSWFENFEYWPRETYRAECHSLSLSYRQWFYLSRKRCRYSHEFMPTDEHARREPMKVTDQHRENNGNFIVSMENSFSLVSCVCVVSRESRKTHRTIVMHTSIEWAFLLNVNSA
jgi:hypothetical protein